jgi:hypothetical protein
MTCKVSLNSATPKYRVWQKYKLTLGGKTLSFIGCSVIEFDVDVVDVDEGSVLSKYLRRRITCRCNMWLIRFRRWWVTADLFALKTAPCMLPP